MLTTLSCNRETSLADTVSSNTTCGIPQGPPSQHTITFFLYILQYTRDTPRLLFVYSASWKSVGEASKFWVKPRFEIVLLLPLLPEMSSFHFVCFRTYARNYYWENYEFTKNSIFATSPTAWLQDSFFAISTALWYREDEFYPTNYVAIHIFFLIRIDFFMVFMAV